MNMDERYVVFVQVLGGDKYAVDEIYYSKEIADAAVARKEMLANYHSNVMIWHEKLPRQAA